MPKQNRFEVEYAKSSMATCRVCMAKIPKGALRIGHLQMDVLENDATMSGAAFEPPTGVEDAEPVKEDKRMAAVSAAARWHHFECFHKMKGEKWMAANLPEKPNEMKGFSEIKKRDQKKVTDLWKAILGNGGTGASTKRKAASSLSSSTAKKAKTQESAAKITKLTSVQGVLTPKQFQGVQKLEQELAGKTAVQLQAELALNNQVRTGKKEELAQRVAEGRLLGALPACPRCEKGQIHWSRVGGWFSCPGHFDSDAKVQKRCNFRSQELKRGKWKKQ
mmetsp:Transcript_8236/g.18818  ORF Transcript_8236/g.18818 Transcript_8236/m.18818 type:complete len:277 (-) Transcript_8236:197-1027(-)